MNDGFYLVSDTHGFIQSYRSLDRTATFDKKAYILGDLFDHKYGDEKDILNILVNMLNEDRAEFIIGNHDLGLLYLLFPKDSYECKVNLLKYSNDIILKVVEGLYDTRTYDLMFDYLNEYKFTQDINKYISNVSQLISNRKFDRINKNLEYLFNDAKKYVEINLGDKKVLLSHSGTISDPYSNEILSETYSCDVDYDLSFIGHVTTTHLKHNLKKVTKSLPLHNFDRGKHPFKDINVKGSFYYNKKHKTFMIDNGTNNNIIEVTYK